MRDAGRLLTVSGKILIFLAVGLAAGFFVNVIFHESGHYIMASAFNASAIKEFCIDPLASSCGGKPGGIGAVIYQGFPNAWTPDFGNDPIKVILVAMAGIIAETVFLVIILTCASRLFLRNKSRLRFYFTAVGMAAYSVIGWWTVVYSVLTNSLSNSSAVSDFCSIGFGLSKLTGNRPALGSCPAPYSFDALFVLITGCTVVLAIVTYKQLKAAKGSLNFN